jgi:hypothetical protein
MVKILILINISMLFLYLSLEAQEVTNSRNEEKSHNIENSDTINIPQSYKNPTSAFFFSLCIPGAGQAYNDEGLKSILCLVLDIAGVVLIIDGNKQVWDRTSLYGKQVQNSKSEANSGLILCGAVYLYSLIDAPLSAIAINNQSKEWMKKNKLAYLNINPVFKQNFSGIELTYHF